MAQNQQDNTRTLYWAVIGVLIFMLIIVGSCLAYLLFLRLAGPRGFEGVTATPKPTSVVTATLLPPGATPIPTKQPTVLPCNWAGFVADVSVPDDSVMKPNQAFTKTWRLKNIGSCAWNANYSVVFVGGTNMGGPTEQKLGTNVNVGQTVDISINLVAPSGSGSYTGNYKLRTDGGVLFGLGSDQQQPFWVTINVTTPSTVEINAAENPCILAWSSTAGNLACPTESYVDGTVLVNNNPPLEGGQKSNQKAITVMPSDGQGGFIRGTTQAFIVKQGDHFKTEVGCMNQQPGCNVTFQLSYQVQGGGSGVLGSWVQVYDGSWDKVDIDLTGLSGQNIQLLLTVYSNNGTSKDNLVFWLAPKLIRYQ